MQDALTTMEYMISSVKSQRHTPYAYICHRAISLTRRQHLRCPHTNRSAAKVLHSPGRTLPGTLCRPSATRPTQLLFYGYVFVSSLPSPSSHAPFTLFLPHRGTCPFFCFPAPCACLFTLSSGWTPCNLLNSKQWSTLLWSLKNHMSRGTAGSSTHTFEPYPTCAWVPSCSAEICQPWIGCTGQLS